MDATAELKQAETKADVERIIRSVCMEYLYTDRPTQIKVVFRWAWRMYNKSGECNRKSK